MAGSQARRKRSRKNNTASKAIFNRKWLMVLLISNFGALLLIGALTKLYYHPWFAVHNIEVDHKLNTSHARQLAQTIVPEMGRSLLVLSTGRLQARINQLNWVKQSAVRRVWPNQLQIKLRKQVPVAYWRHHGLLDRHGKVFTFNQSHDAKLPVIEAGSSDYPDAFQCLQTLQKELKTLNIQPAQLVRYGSRAWRVTLNNDLVIYLDDDHFSQELEHLTASYSQLFRDKEPQRYYLDLRYPHGLALGKRS